MATRRSDPVPRGPKLLLGLIPCLLAGLVLLGAMDAQAQFIAFGKNKIQYSQFDWQMLESSHFQLYYYPEEEHLARRAIQWAEESYARLRELFATDVGRPIPLIIYSSHQDFEQTNITPFFLPEGVAGLTEFARGRVLIPFNGSINDFRETLQHELVHVFQLSVIVEAHRMAPQDISASPPLWFTEGLAVHWSEDRDSRADMILSDMTLTGRLPAITEFWRYQGTFTMYKLGQSVMDFLGETYGEDRIREFYTRLGTVRIFDDLFPLIYGETVEEISRRWEHAVRKRYFPTVQSEEPALFEGRLLARSGADFKPTPVPDGIEGFSDSFVFISARTGFASIYAADTETGDLLDEVVKGQRRPEFESFHPLQSRLDISSRGELAFVSKHDEKDAVFTLDLETKEVTGRFGFDGLIALLSPSWFPDGDRLVFSGLSRSGRSDLYVYDRATKQLERLTDDLYQDISPAVRPTGDEIVFVSDRGPHGRKGARNLFLMNLETREIRFLTNGPWDDLSPSWSPDGEQVLFSSSRSGSYDLYTVDRNGDGRRRTRATETLLDPRWLPDGKGVLCGLFTLGSFQCVRVDLNEEFEAISLEVPAHWSPWSEEVTAQTVTPRSSRYKSRLSLDIAQGAVAVDPAFRSGEGVQALLSDLMGNRLLFLQLGNSTVSTSDFARNFSAGATLLDLGRRLNRGVSLYHISGDFYDAEGLPYFERRVGGSFLLSYPFDRFNRVETSASLAYSEKQWPSRLVDRKGMIATHYLSFVRDNSLWLPTGPIDGSRTNLTVGLVMNVKKLSTENALAVLDLRRYFRLGLRSAYAVRFQTRISHGPDPSLFLLGGSNSFRGYSYRAFVGTRALILNQEVRFPLLRGFAIGLPMGVMTLPGVEGAAFFDAGQAWEEENLPDEIRGSYGLSFRMGLGGFLVFRFDLARRTDFNNWPGRVYSDFFIGWDY